MSTVHGMMSSTKKSISTEILDGSSSNVKRNTQRKGFFVFGIFLCTVGVSSLIVSTVLLLKRPNIDISTACPKKRIEKDEPTQKPHSGCFEKGDDHSQLQDLFKTIKATYHEFSPKVELKNSAGKNEERPNPFNFTPEAYQQKTRTAQSLLKEMGKREQSLLTTTVIDEERHTFELFKHFLSNTFGEPYENNYEAGDWLMGPNIFCWQKSCQLTYKIFGALANFVPGNGEDVEKMIELMKECGEAFRQRMRNLKYGVAVGIVPPEEACRAGLSYFKLIHINVAKHGKKGILSEDTAIEILNSSFINKIKKEDRIKWKQKYNVSIQQSLSLSLLDNIGEPLHDLIRYLDDDYITHCPPSNVSSGYASLPLQYVYTNGARDPTRPTCNGSLPGGEKFNGSRAYEILLSFFTTYDVTPKEIDELANKALEELYPKVVKIAKELTKQNDSAAAIKQFQAELASQQFYYKLGNDSHNITQHLMCSDAETAKKYCPERWKAMNKWLQSARAILSQLRTKISSAFYLSGDKNSVPICPVDIEFDFNPSSAYYSYGEGGKNCLSLAKIGIPFFLDKLGPKYEEMTVLAHESYPGHHLEVQGIREHFKFKCESMGEWVSKMNYFAAFSEGWATYVEKHVADVDMKLYKDDLIKKYGMLKHQILAALRAKVDVGLHYMGMTRHEVIALYVKYVWDSGDVVNKEITRLQSAPGQGTSYMVGEHRISGLRKKAVEQLGDKFDVRDFHFNVLRKGSLPMTYLSTKIDEYISKNSKR